MQRRTGQRACAYCGQCLIDTYTHWLLLTVDHVVPTSVGLQLGIPGMLMEDCINKVLACAGCNGLGNRYRHVPSTTTDEWSLDTFVTLRDTIFGERALLIQKLRAIDVSFFESRPWEAAL